jgi:N-acetylmuramic acid 6-phosphate etherase
MKKITEQPSLYRHLEKMTVEELVKNINNEDKKVAIAIEGALPQLADMIKAIEKKLKNGGRMFYLGAGSGGRLSVLDKVELPNTFGIEKGMINSILAGGEEHLTEAPEEKEDDEEDALRQMNSYHITPKDFVIGISASGTTPFVLAGLKKCRAEGITCGCIVNNPDSPIATMSNYPVIIITGPEFITGSTRMKCGTAQKMIFDMISTTVLIRLGRIEDNKMVNVRLINNKVIDRSTRMLIELSGLQDYEQARHLIITHQSVKKAMNHLNSQKL